MKNKIKPLDVEALLFEIVQFIHDNDRAFMNFFLPDSELTEMDSVHLSGSTVLVLYDYGMCNNYLCTGDVLQWVQDEWERQQ